MKTKYLHVIFKCLRIQQCFDFVFYIFNIKKKVIWLLNHLYSKYKKQYKNNTFEENV